MYINAKEHHNWIQTSTSIATRDKLGAKTAISGADTYRAYTYPAPPPAAAPLAPA